MKNIKTVLAISFVLVSITVFGQVSSNQIIKQSKNQYKYQDRIYDKHELGDIFQKDQVLADGYADAMRKYKVSKRLGYGTLGLFSFGVVAIAIPNPNYDCDNCWPALDVVGALAILATPITGTIATLRHFQYKGRLDKVINGFNGSQHDVYGRQIEKPSIGLSTQGAGFTISF